MRKFRTHPNCPLHIEKGLFCQGKIERGKGLQILFNIDFFPNCVTIDSITPQLHKGEKEREKRFFHCFDPFWQLSFLN